jgi:copper chaperone
MIAFEVNDMTCGHCASTITKAVNVIDGQAKVDIDLNRHLVSIESGLASADSLADAIREAGYTPVQVQASAVVTSKKSCCGHCH